MPFSLSTSQQQKEIRRRIVGCRDRLRRTRGTQKIAERATVLEADGSVSYAEEVLLCDASKGDEGTRSAGVSPSENDGGAAVERRESGAEEEGIEA
jgi:hypothetical protein